MVMGTMMTFFDRSSMMKYRMSDKFKANTENDMIEKSSLKVMVHENLAGSELTHERAQWPSSKDKGPVNRKDI
jgi:hypothetical protein